MPRLRVVAGPSLDALVPISVNTGKAHDVSSPLFKGKIAAYIKDFPDENGNVLSSEYFERPERKGVTWSIQVQGRFLNEVSANDVLFGNTFSRPLTLPWGVGAAFKFMKYVDPTLEHDLGSKTKPWALSPLLSTMPYLVHSRDGGPNFPSTNRTSIGDDVTQLALSSPPSSPASSRSSSSLSSMSSDGSERDVSPVEKVAGVKAKKTKRSWSSRSSRSGSEEGSSAGVAAKIPAGNTRARRTYFADEKHRKEVMLGPEDTITTDFAYGFLTFVPTPALNLPGGISFDLMRYWDGQPVRFMCCERKREGQGSEPWGRVFWCVAIELVQDD
ncbi:unnamed protein product [Peniophora sp. CBMAI 1063]|nr:unnamed protein product [Peniophora sp. CBMAI 1063]